MWEKNLRGKVLIVAVVVLSGILLLYFPGYYRPADRLRPGLDIAGGVSLIYEIDDTGLEDHPNLAEDMKRLLQRRVDPQGVYDLAWRVHGRNRLEVQMPLPPPRVAELRSEYAEALEDLFATSVTRGQLERALQLSEPQRDAALEELAGGVPRRRELLDQAAQAYDGYAAAMEAYRASLPDSPPATEPTTAPTAAQTAEELELELRDAEEALEDAYDAFLATNLDHSRFQGILELDPGSAIREPSLRDFRERHPNLAAKIDQVIVKHDEWRRNRGYLDGPADLQRLLRGAGVLEFRILAEPSPEHQARFDHYRRQLQERGPTPAPGDEYGWFQIDEPLTFFDLKTPAELEVYDLRQSRYVAEKLGNKYYVLARLGAEHGLLARDRNWQLRSAMIGRDHRGALCVDFMLDVVGGALFEELTRKNIGKPLCILVDDVAYSAPIIRSKIRAQGQISGDFSFEKVNYLVQTMQAGSLPARLKDTPISERTIGSSLGATNRDIAFRSGIIGICAILAFMTAYYLRAGMVADVAMLLNLLLVLAVMAVLQARINLAGIAGIALTAAMSVDANVLIFERMREEKERGSSLRLIVKNGYEKAFWPIFDSNVTTMLTSAILYYVGSEEIKGFGLTLGWGIAISMFTALFVTRTVFAVLISAGWLKDIRMLKLIGVPKIDWYGLRKIFIPLSIVTSVGGLWLFAARGANEILDIEFLGGVSADVEVIPAGPGEPPLDDIRIAELLAQTGAAISDDADKLATAEVRPVIGLPGTFRIRVPGMDAERLAAMVAEPLEDQRLLRRDGVELHGEPDSITVRVAGETSAEQLQDSLRELVPSVKAAGDNLAAASVGAVMEAALGAPGGRFWNITTTEKNRRLVQHALEVTLGDRLQRQQRVRYTLRTDEHGRPFPVTDRRLARVVQVPDFPATVAAEPVTDFLGGAAFYFADLDPPQSVDPQVPGSIPDRLKNMRLQPGYQDFPYRLSRVIGVQSATSAGGAPMYSGVVVVVADPNYRYADDPVRWETEFATKELQLARAALDTEQALRKVSQFKPQVARQSTTQASMALLLSWAMIIGYMWVRFGRARFGVAGVVAVLHDLCIVLAFLGLSGWIGGAHHPVGSALLLDKFRVNMIVVAALLTVIGYSVNDTIVIFDRIREMRGRLGQITPQLINDAINQCMSRTLLTGITTIVVLLVLYIFGGSSIRPFSFCMMIGVLTGTYSSFAVAAPLLMVRAGHKMRPATA